MTKITFYKNLHFPKLTNQENGIALHFCESLLSDLIEDNQILLSGAIFNLVQCDVLNKVHEENSLIHTYIVGKAVFP